MKTNDIQVLCLDLEALERELLRNWKHICEVNLEVDRARIEEPESDRLASAKRRQVAAERERAGLVAARNEARKRLNRAKGLTTRV